MVTDEELRHAFEETYNGFWCKYKNRQPAKDSQEWDRIMDQYGALCDRFPFMRTVLATMVVELDSRMRKH